MTIGNAGILHRDERSWWMTGPNSLKQLRAWKQCVQQCYTAGSQKPPVMITIADGNISMAFEGNQRVCKISWAKGIFSETNADESMIIEPTLEDEVTEEREDQHERLLQENCPVTGFRIWEGRQGEVELVYFRLKKLLEWEQLALLTGASDAEVQADDDAETTHRPEGRTDMRGIESHVVRKIVMEQEPWQDEESTVAWERYMQTEGLCDSKEKPLG